MLAIFFLVIHYILIVYSIIMSIYIISTWIPALSQFKVFRIIAEISSWYLEPMGNVLVVGSIDFTPIISLGIFGYIANIAFELALIL